MSNNSTPKNIKYVSGVATYNVSPTDDIVNVDTSGGPVLVVLPNIQGSGLILYRKQFFINDATSNAGSNNITIVGAGCIVNSGQNALININGGSSIATIVDINEYQVATDSAGGGGGGLQPISGSIYHDAYTEGAVSLLINVPAKPKYVVFSSDALYILDNTGAVLENLTDPVGPHTTTFYGFSTGGGFGNDIANVVGLNYYQNILIQDPSSNPLGTIPNQFVIQQPVCFINGMRWTDQADAGTYGTCTNFTDTSFNLDITPYGSYPFISNINWTAFF